MTRTMDGWMVSVTAGVPNCGPRGQVGVGRGVEGEGDGHHYQHYVARRKIPLAVMVGCISVRLLLSQMSGCVNPWVVVRRGH